MKHIIFSMALFAMMIVFAGCKPTTNQAGATSPSTTRLEIVDGPLRWSGGWVYIVRDKKTEQEFIMIDGPESVAVCPIRVSPKQEE